MTHIPARFRRELELHIVQNLRRSSPVRAALILGIHGPSGEGKTYQTEQLLKEADVETLLVSGGQLESGEAGEPAKIVREAYLHAGVYVKNGRPAAVLLNDADAAIGSWGELTQYTVNTQNVVTELMHLADYPNRVEGQDTPRVPIVITGNDFSRLYGPLCRPGRMVLFRWVLSESERAKIVAPLFPFLSEAETGQLLCDFPGRSVAFWSAVRAQQERNSVLDIVAQHDLKIILDHLIRGGELRSDEGPPSLHSVLTAAQSLVENERTVHL